MKILLTGGAGFIGSVVLRRLNQKGIKNIYLVDDLGSDDRWNNLVGKQFIDLIHKDQLFDHLKQLKLDAIIHLGACSSTTEKNAHFLLENNTHYSMRLASFAIDHKLRFIYASSAATYGDGAQGFSDKHALLEQYHPLNMYGFSKHLFDLWLWRQGWLEKKIVGLKYFNVFGPNEFHKGRMASAILKMVADLKKEGKIYLFKSTSPQDFKDGEQVRDFVYVKDAAEMTVQFLDNSFTGLYNIGTGLPQTWNNLAQAVLKAMQGKGEIVYTNMPDDLQGKYQNYTCADMSKSKTNKLYLPQYSLETSVSEYVQEYVLSHKYY